MGKRDRRQSLKMRRRKAQAAKKEREKSHKPVKVAPEVASKTKKPRAPKSAALSSSSPSPTS
jgi:hypothetical protein